MLRQNVKEKIKGTITEVIHEPLLQENAQKVGSVLGFKGETFNKIKQWFSHPKARQIINSPTFASKEGIELANSITSKNISNMERLAINQSRPRFTGLVKLGIKNLVILAQRSADTLDSGLGIIAVHFEKFIRFELTLVAVPIGLYLLALIVFNFWVHKDVSSRMVSQFNDIKMIVERNTPVLPLFPPKDRFPERACPCETPLSVAPPTQGIIEDWFNMPLNSFD